MAETGSRTGVGELTVLRPSQCLHLEAANLWPRTIRTYADDGTLPAAFLTRQGMLIAVASIRREHVEAFMAAELARTAPSSAATRYRLLQQLFKWLDDEGEISGSPMVKMRPPIIPESRYPSCRTTKSRACPLRVRARTSAAVATPRSSGCPSIPAGGSRGWSD